MTFPLADLPYFQPFLSPLPLRLHLLRTSPISFSRPLARQGVI
jgi:hypothetical protein